MKSSHLISALALAIPIAGCETGTKVEQISCDSPENPTGTLVIRTKIGTEALCSFGKIANVGNQTSRHCLTLKKGVIDFPNDAIVSPSLTQKGREINPDILSINSVGKAPPALPISPYTDHDLNGKTITIFASNPHEDLKKKSCYKITGEYISDNEGSGFVLMNPGDYKSIQTAHGKNFGGSSGSVVTANGKIAGTLSGQSSGNNPIAQVLNITPIRNSDGSIKNQ